MMRNSMNEMDRMQCAAYARLPVFKRRVERAQAVIAEALALPGAEKFYAAFSGGVDSTVLLDLVRQHPVGATLDVVWGDDGWDYPETLAFLRQAEEHWWFTLKRIRCLDPWRDWCEEMDRPDLAETPDTIEHGQPVWGNPRLWQATWRSLTRDAGAVGGYGGVLLGMLGKRRKEGGESTRRAIILRNGARPLYQVAAEHEMWHCSPLASWDKQTVWAYIVSRGLPYNAAYDRLAALGVPLEHRRVAPLTAFRVTQYGSLALVRQGWPDVFNRLAAIFPAARRYG